MRHSLNSGWSLIEQPLSRAATEATMVERETGRWFDVTVPCDVHEPLIAAGVIDEPLKGLSCFESEWIEERSWWFRRTLELSAQQLSADRLEIVFESLDTVADVFLNGFHLGDHRNAHRPFSADIRREGVPGSNTLLVRLTAGAERINSEQTQPFGMTVSKTYRRGDDRRVFLRKPQYVYGWDWAPRVVTCGITGDVYLNEASGVLLHDCTLRTIEVAGNGGQARVEATILIENLEERHTREAKTSVSLDPPNEGSPIRASVSSILISGLNWIEMELQVDNAELWWPSGMGSQSLYEVRIRVESEGVEDEFEPSQFGIRTIALNQDPVPSGRKFLIEVNGQPVFCRGANWIPADSIYSRVSNKKYEALVTEAGEANFTMLRVWGGGIYERDIFYELCDRHGILVWQDFMYACAVYPDDESWFLEESRLEIDYQTRRLRNHPCIALFCGNNENVWIFDTQWVGDRAPERFGGAHVYNRIAPQVIRNNCPWIPYWSSSPYGGKDANGNEVGDRHHWLDCTMHPEMERRITPEEYDKVRSKFISEYGYIGPCSRRTIERYHGDEPITRDSDVWDWHNNTFEKATVVAGIRKHYADAESMDLDRYLYYAGLCQALMLGYSLESIRSQPDCSGGLFWMFNDCWGEVGWTIIDYYLDRKPSYYAVKRAFAPRRLIVRPETGSALIHLCNDTAEPLDLAVDAGFVSFDGSVRETEAMNLVAPAFSQVQAEVEVDLTRAGRSNPVGLFAVVPRNQVASDPTDSLSCPVVPAYVRPGVFRELRLPQPEVGAIILDRDSDSCPSDVETQVQVSSDRFAHAVHLELPEGAVPDDDYFDLLPGEQRVINVKGLCMPTGEHITATAAIPDLI